MVLVEYPGLLVLAVLAGLAAWFLARRGRRGILVALGAALSAAIIVVALAGVVRTEGSALRVYLVDVSASARGAPAALLPAIRADAAAELRPTDRVAIIAFGRNASVLIPPTAARDLPAELPPPAGIDQDGTSFEAALETAAALFADGAAGDLVFVTDGRATTGDAATRAAALDRPIHSLTLPTAPENDAWIESVRAPAAAAEGQDFAFEIVAGATAPMRGKLILLVDGRQLARPETVDLIERQTVLVRRVRIAGPWLHTLTAQLRCEGDTTSENDAASAAVRVRGKLTVLCVSDGKPAALADLLEKNESIVVRRTRPEALIATNEAMLSADVVVLDDVAADKLGDARLKWLRRFVSDAGRGLVVFGGRRSLGPGGYAETPLAALLPVDVDPERRAGKPTSVAIVADRSGSMAAPLGGRKKIDFVREAVLRAGVEFGGRPGKRSDELSVIAFNESPTVLLDRQQPRTADGLERLRAAAGALFPSGRTRIRPALETAEAILQKSDLKRHIILVSDGRSQDELAGAALAARMKTSGIVLSVLATEATMNDGLTALEAAAEATGGRFVALKTVADLPAAMARETRRITDSLIREGEFAIQAGPGANWLGELPLASPITGYVLTGARAEAPPLLVADGAPILVRWRRGLGRVVTCTTSLDGWAAAWKPEGAAFLEQLVLSAGGGDRQTALAVTLEPAAGRLRIIAGAAKPLENVELAAAVFPPGGEAREIELRQTGRLRYEGSAAADRQGTYVAKVMDRKAGETLGEGHVTIGYSPEWRPDGDASAARRLSNLTGGVALKNLRALPPLQETGRGGSRVPLAHILLCAAAAIFLAASLR